MMDLVRKNGDKIDVKKLAAELGCQVVEISALKGEGGVEAAEKAAAAAQAHKVGELPHVFTGSVEHAIAHIEESIQGKVDEQYLRLSLIHISLCWTTLFLTTTSSAVCASSPKRKRNCVNSS